MTSTKEAKISGHSANFFDLGGRWAVFLREEAYPGRSAAKRIARDWRVSEGTAKLWLAGHLPASKYLEAAWARWGERFVAKMFAAQAELDGELDSVKARLARLEERIADEDSPLAAAADAGVLAARGQGRDAAGGMVAGERKAA